MIVLNRSRPFPICLHLEPQSATLVQLAGRLGRLELHALAQAEMPDEQDAHSEGRDHEIAAVLRKLVADHRFKGRQVVSCLSPDDLFVKNVRLPKLPEDEVAKVVVWEGEERLPYPTAEAQIRHLTAGEVRQDANVKQEVILLACRHEAINRHISLLEEARLTPLAIDVEPCAALRCLRHLNRK